MEFIEKYKNIFTQAYSNYAGYLWNEVSNPHWGNYFYWLIGVSLFFFLLEVVIPWRKKQATFRKDFWLDGFYMFFNFFLFSLIIYNAASDVVVNLFNDAIMSISGGFDLQLFNPMNRLPMWAILLIGFVVRDFVQWNIHRLLHSTSWLWQFHKVHHSVEEMGFAAHLRYHWMENVVYRSLEYIPLALLGIGLYDFFVIHIFTLAWGHYNHSNISVSGYLTGGIIGALIGLILAFNLADVYLFIGFTSPLSKLLIVAISIAGGSLLLGPLMKKIFNSPEMHIWHHAYEVPDDRPSGMNYGLTLALWDYLFGTAYIPHNGREIKLGFPGLEEFPENFVQQNVYGFGKKGAK